MGSDFSNPSKPATLVGTQYIDFHCKFFKRDVYNNFNLSLIIQ